MDNEKLTKLKKILFIIALPMLILIIYVIVLYVSRIGKIPTKIKYAPFTSTVSLNGQIFQNNSEQFLSPGEYSVVVSLDNFDTLEETVYIDEYTEYLFGFLFPNNSEGEIIRKNYSSDYLEIEKIAGEVANTRGQREREEKPILNSLPFKNSLFSIGYTYDEEKTFIVTIRSSRTYLDSAIEKLKELDSLENLSKYNVRIVDFENELENPSPNSQADPKSFLEKSFPNAIIIDGEYFDNYYYTKIITGSGENYSLTTYRVLLQKTDSSWTFIGTPYPFLTVYNTSDSIPIEVLIKVNNY